MVTVLAIQSVERSMVWTLEGNMVFQHGFNLGGLGTWFREVNPPKLPPVATGLCMA